ncbi:MAG: hypothetical protein BJ554DRAFT_2283 [Olpidium bornovanus]|uniref:Transmembrane protein n=1 Tax=Olpidium bornovanus TaxID=278681 RepID=A0A8H7ZR17_9FUNG|nr:MAG: hypothetical protein BJ554DRAFT_2283 [Olpidium bornovanus]
MRRASSSPALRKLVRSAGDRGPRSENRPFSLHRLERVLASPSERRVSSSGFYDADISLVSGPNGHRCVCVCVPVFITCVCGSGVASAIPGNAVEGKPGLTKRAPTPVCQPAASRRNPQGAPEVRETAAHGREVGGERAVCPVGVAGSARAQSARPAEPAVHSGVRKDPARVSRLLPVAKISFVPFFFGVANTVSLVFFAAVHRAVHFIYARALDPCQFTERPSCQDEPSRSVDIPTVP